MARLKVKYTEEIAPALMNKFQYKSVMQIPKLEKVVVNVAAGEAKDNAKVIDAIMTDLAAITGQRPVVCRAKKSVANFKLREGMHVGVKVTLRQRECTSSYTSCSMSASRVYVTSVASTAIPSTVRATTPPVSRNS